MPQKLVTSSHLLATHTHTHTYIYTRDLDGHLLSDWRKISPPLGTFG
jgi:hypothetical protein